MTPQELIAAFDVLADAPDGVKRLRELVLSLAVRGKLVRQEAGDEPAGNLLLRINKKQATLIQQGAMRRPKSATTSIEEAPSILPAGWTWCRLGELLQTCTNGTSVAPNDDGDGPRLLRISAATGQPGWYVDMDDCRFAHMPEEKAHAFFVNAGDLLVCRFNGNLHYVGSAAQVPPFSGAPPMHPDKLIRLVGIEIDHRYLLLAINSETSRQQIERDAATTAGNIGINGKQLQNLILPLAPLPEQHRIVARVDELMGLLDRLEAARTTRDAVRRQARDAALADLRNAPDADAVEAAWSRIAAHMDDLFTHPEDIAPLRQAVLQLAVRGRLVPQDAGDAPLGDQMATGPAGWTEGKIEAWFNVVGGLQKSSKRTPIGNGYPYLRVANVQRGHFILDHIARFELFDGELDRYQLVVGDILIVEGNGSESEIGRCARWSGEIANCVHQNHLIRCRPKIAGIEHFAMLFLNSPSGMDLMRSLAVTTSGLYNLSVGKIKSITMPLPPLPEQHRIVARVDALMSLCDALEARLTAARDLHAQFAAAAVHHLDATP